MNNGGEPKKALLPPDSEVEWYDFGGGFTVDTEGNKVPGLQSDAPNMAALGCVRNGLFYYKVIEGTFTKEDLPRMLKEYSTAFEDEINRKTQETQ